MFTNIGIISVCVVLTNLDRQQKRVHPPALRFGVGLLLFIVALPDREDVKPKERGLPGKTLLARVLTPKKSLQCAADLQLRLGLGQG